MLSNSIVALALVAMFRDLQLLLWNLLVLALDVDRLRNYWNRDDFDLAICIMELNEKITEVGGSPPLLKKRLQSILIALVQRMLYRIPIRNLVNYEIGGTATAIIDLNVICTLVNYVAQSIILVQKYQCWIKDYPPYLDWITFAAAMISCVGTVSSLIKYKNRPPHKGRGFNFLFSLVLVAYTGHALAVHSDPRLWASVFSNVLLFVTKANSVYKKEYYLLGDTIVPISGI
ncbi:hypothetical protein POM88_020570 [Heracleum sosnowskyi]|uniref:Uncharacterized protein n=1 Tax=Heracleum sosnowskyi TaxID=360622 RepID=A0AAD8IC52_9APIA|nr:hypothetical protein POM88_020570 [Heracleum sosnowskyi]